MAPEIFTEGPRQRVSSGAQSSSTLDNANDDGTISNSSHTETDPDGKQLANMHESEVGAQPDRFVDSSKTTSKKTSPIRRYLIEGAAYTEKIDVYA